MTSHFQLDAGKNGAARAGQSGKNWGETKGSLEKLSLWTDLEQVESGANNACGIFLNSRKFGHKIYNQTKGMFSIFTEFWSL